MTTLLLFLAVISALILIHEAGHLVVAKLSGVWVHQFSIGFGPDILSFKKNETTYSLKPILIGGYVRMAGEDVSEEESEDKEVPEERKLYSQHPLIKSAIASAGSVTNILFAVLLTITIVGATGVPRISIYGTLEDSPSKGVIKQGDIISRIDGDSIIRRINSERIYSTDQINSIVQKNEGKPLEITVRRNGETLTKTVKPRWYEDRDRYMLGVSLGPAATTKIKNLSEDSVLKKRGLKRGDVIESVDGEKVRGWIGLLNYFQEHSGEEMELALERNGATKKVSLPEVDSVEKLLKGVTPYIRRRSIGPLTSIRLGLDQIKTILVTTYRGLKKVFGGQIAARKAVSGPVGIANYLGKSLNQGLNALFTLIALISLNLGFVNLLPFPALDGSRIGFAFYELIVGKPIPPEKEGLIHSIGFFILIGLLIFLTYNDLMRIFQ